jgi:hypothetical protein
MNNAKTELEALWRSAPAGGPAFDPRDYAHLPAPVQRYLAHAIAPGTALASAVRLRMHGSIKITRWRPFKAEQVIVRGRGMIWRASVRMLGMTIRGFDRLVDGEGAMRWNALGVIPVMRASGPDIARSAAGRVAAEAVWLPAIFCGADVAWDVADPQLAHARFAVDRHPVDLAIALDQGCVQSVAMRRWGNPDGAFRESDFGAVIEQEGTFGGYTIPVRLRVGWHFGSDRFESEGKFFHVTIDDAVYR